MKLSLDQASPKSRYHDKILYRELLFSFVYDLPNEILVLKEDLENSDAPSAIKICHKLSGTSATYGYPELSKFLENIEQLLKRDTQNIEDAKSLISPLNEYIEKVQETLNQFKEGG